MEYSVIIRTLGKAGSKYQQLLDSIKNSTLKPKDIIVVLPNGYETPNEKLGFEKFYFSSKGMVKQRLTGIDKCNTPYALIIDDDIAFEPDFVKKVAEPVINHQYAISSGPLLEFFPQKGKAALLSAISGGAVPTVFHKDRYNTVLKTTGYSYNRNIIREKRALYETQSAAWTCFFADIEKLRDIRFQDELWLDKHGYSTHDDTAMFYKAWINGIKSVIVADAHYVHLDAKTSQKNNQELRAFCNSFNTQIFWRRFIYERSTYNKRWWCRICIDYYFIMSKLILYSKYFKREISKETIMSAKQRPKKSLE